MMRTATVVDLQQSPLHPRQAMGWLDRVALFLGVVLLVSCSLNSAKKRYILAEKLWAEGKYQSAVQEFERVSKRDPNGQLGLQALFRAAMTQTLFLGHHHEAVANFSAYAKKTPEPGSAWLAEKEIGEILFTRLKNYSEAIKHYRHLLREGVVDEKGLDQATDEDAAFFLFRIGKSHFFMTQFDEAIRAFSDVVIKYPSTNYAEKASFEIGVTHYTRGEDAEGGLGPEAGSYIKAIHAYNAFKKIFPKSSRIAEADFGIAMSLEELDQLDKAFNLYQKLQDRYPSPQVIKVKLARIKERMQQRDMGEKKKNERR